jgi:type I restriction enzyme, S subunit
MDWETVEIKDITLGVYDGPHATPKESEDGPIFLGISELKPEGGIDLSNTTHLSEEDFLIWTRRVTPRANDIVFSYEATLHRYAIIPEGLRCCLGRRLALIRVDDSKADYKFIYYSLLSPAWRNQVEARTIAGATVDRIPLIDFPSFKLKLPPLHLQRRIAEVLGRYDALIDNYQRQIGILEASAQALYREWFVRGRCPYAKYEADEKPPLGWERVKLGDVLELKYGKSLTEETRTGSSYPVVGSSGIVDFHDEFLVDKGGIVVGRKGNVGSVFWIDKPFFPIDTAFYVESELSLYYLFFNLKTQNFISGDAAVPGLNREQALSNEMIKPAGEVLEEFDRIVKPTFEKVGNLQSQVALLRQMRDRLLPRLMSGQIPVTTAE